MLKIFEWPKFAQISKWNFSRISRRIFLKILWWTLTLVLNIISKIWDGVIPKTREKIFLVFFNSVNFLLFIITFDLVEILRWNFGNIYYRARQHFWLKEFDLGLPQGEILKIIFKFDFRYKNNFLQFRLKPPSSPVFPLSIHIYYLMESCNIP